MGLYAADQIRHPRILGADWLQTWAWIVQTEFVLHAVEDRNIKFIRLWFTDVLGFLEIGRHRPR